MENKHSNLYMIISIVFVACLLISNIAAFKQWSFGPITLTAGALLFPITYIVNDLLAEVYGFNKAKKVIWTGFIMNIFMVGYFQLAIILPAAAYFANQDAFALVLGNTPRILAASLVAYAIGGLTNAYIMSKMKVATKGKYLSARVIASTIVGELLDSSIFVFIAFAFILPTPVLITMMISQTVVKTLIEIVLYPVTRQVIFKVKNIEGIDVYDENLKYHVFKG